MSGIAETKRKDASPKRTKKGEKKKIAHVLASLLSFAPLSFLSAVNPQVFLPPCLCAEKAKMCILAEAISWARVTVWSKSASDPPPR
jgi:hypothetical protein